MFDRAVILLAFDWRLSADLQVVNVMAKLNS
jgi:hypothetical protein